MNLFKIDFSSLIFFLTTSLPVIWGQPDANVHRRNIHNDQISFDVAQVV